MNHPRNLNARADASESMAERIELLRPLLPRALIDGDGWTRILAQARALPATPELEIIGFELRLGDATPAADFVLTPWSDSRVVRHYIARGESSAPDSPAAALGNWFAAHEAQHAADSFRAQANDLCILEYDLIDLPAELAHDVAALDARAPGVFLQPRAGAAFDDPDALVGALNRIAGWPPDADELRAVRRVFAALDLHGAGGKVHQGGVLPARTPRFIRLVMPVAVERAIDVLTAMQWRGPMQRVRTTLDDFRGAFSDLMLSVEVRADGIGDRLGLEMLAPHTWTRPDQTAWKDMIAELERRGLCLPAKAYALRDWPGVEQLFGARRAYYVPRGINHFKLVITPKGIAAKAYIGLSMRVSHDAPAQ